ncbi:serine hydrolase [Ectobacillus ponti]|uniref:Class A beta-lactamase-related serine hydrolase n=1 Tax=Ectobacillus ponti TaxID=2961894 RepID=A0AA42BR68_9BACI|nr:serine hydrolase [Ectobacillus ponti]MCP8969174.1 class A beta-lactamase-related serine hydrolase [Ectobacillus ponti]
MKPGAWTAVILFAVAAMLGGGFLFAKKSSQQGGDILRYVETNKGKKRCALLIKRNDEVVYEANPDLVLPLASTVKLVVAYEFARQAAAGLIRPQELVSLHELRAYYVPGTDGGAHEEWLRDVENRPEWSEGAVTLEEAARGMMRFSSNANTEFLMDRLGIQNINRTMQELGLLHHRQLFPIVSSLYIPGYLHQELGLSKKEVQERMQRMTQSEYEQYAFLLHERLKKGNGLHKNIPLWSGPQYENIWSHRLPAASAADYVRLLERVNNERLLDPALQRQWKRIAETAPEPPPYRGKLRWAGQKGGYTASVLATAAYATDQAGNRTEIVFLADELSEEENKLLRGELKKFTYQTFLDHNVKQALR